MRANLYYFIYTTCAVYHRSYIWTLAQYIHIRGIIYFLWEISCIMCAREHPINNLYMCGARAFIIMKCCIYACDIESHAVHLRFVACSLSFLCASAMRFKCVPYSWALRWKVADGIRNRARLLSIWVYTTARVYECNPKIYHLDSAAIAGKWFHKTRRIEYRIIYQVLQL